MTNPASKLKTIVIEDERLPRLSLLQKLEQFSNDVEVIDSCDSYDSALHAILREKPELLFLDIQLQGRDAIQLLDELQKIQPLPYVIFTTAYNERQYLMSAIRISAIDYLIKPIDTNALAFAVAKAVKRKAIENPGATGEQPPGLNPHKIALKTISGKIILEENDMVYLKAFGNYSKLTTFSHTETIMESLGTIESLLDSSIFIRCDRSTIVNTKLIYKIDTKRHICVFRAPDGTTIQAEISKAGMDTLQQIF